MTGLQVEERSYRPGDGELFCGLSLVLSNRSMFRLTGCPTTEHITAEPVFKH